MVSMVTFPVRYVGLQTPIYARKDCIAARWEQGRIQRTAGRRRAPLEIIFAVRTEADLRC